MSHVDRSDGPAAESRASVPLAAVVLDAMGVIFQSGDDVAELLVPFVRKHNPAAGALAIAECYRRCSLGEISSGDLWRQLGVDLPGVDIDESYLRGHRLMVGLHEFLDVAEALGLRVGCISNDVAEWSRRLREEFDLARRISPWIVSGDVGSRKPDRAIFERFLEDTGLPPGRCLFVDDRVDNLDAALGCGFRTVLFDPGLGSPRTRHARCRGFAELVRCLRDRVTSTPPIPPGSDGFEMFLATLPRLDRGRLLAIIAAWEAGDPAAMKRAWAVVRERARAARGRVDLERAADAIAHWAVTPDAITGQESGAGLDFVLSDLRRRAAPALLDAAAATLLGDRLDDVTRDVLLTPWRSADRRLPTREGSWTSPNPATISCSRSWSRS